ncbi:hypothetical protein [Aurantiacibacter sp. MUD61]|uniref:hypothetical protein n=1 Tax=Aurantiacibacter sp. MUD61 TaxID=3009083 RepID=UPI0022F0BE67|nr:hypothetical protein [Aurantiacibacter sp. MUD61]
MEDSKHIDYGALVGWASSQAGDRISLRMQSVTKPPPHERDDVHSHIYLMDRNQAVQLANYLFEISGQSRPSRRGRGLFARLFG